MKKSGKNSVLALSIALCAVITAAGCSKTKVESAAVVSFCSGDVSIKHGTDVKKMNLRDQLTEGDQIISGDKSLAVIQLSGGTVCRIESNTVVAFSALKSEEKQLTLDKGIVLSKVVKLGKGSGYLVKTQHAVAAVRGTQFMAAVNGGESTISVGEGKVAVTNLSSAAAPEKALDAGSTAVVSSDVSLRSLNDNEKKELDKIKDVAYFEKIEKKTDEELINAGKKLLDSDAEKSVLTLSDIQKKYERVDVVTLYSGKVIKGAIVSRGARIQMVTTSGTISIESNQIKSTSSE